VVLLVAVLVLCTQGPAWLALVRLLRTARSERRTRATWEGAIEARLAGQDRQLGNLARALALLVPSDARPTTAHRARLPLPPPVEAVVTPPASRPSPRIRADVRPSGFGSDRVACYGTAERGESIVVDARDVDEREGTLRVEVVDAASRADEVLVQLPPERVPRGPHVWLPRGLVLDLASASSPARRSSSPSRRPSETRSRFRCAMRSTSSSHASLRRRRSRTSGHEGTMASMAFGYSDRLVIVVYGQSAPAPRDWIEFLHFVHETGIERTMHLVYSEGGQPTARQQGQLVDLFAGRVVPHAVLTDSARIRSRVRLLALLARPIRAFPVTGLRDAVGYLDIPASRITVIERDLQRLRGTTS
jgi:hypothetical protein